MSNSLRPPKAPMSFQPSLLLPSLTSRAWFPRLEEAGDASLDHLEREEEEYARFLRTISDSRPARDPLGTHVGVGGMVSGPTGPLPAPSGGSHRRAASAGASSGVGSSSRGGAYGPTTHPPPPSGGRSRSRRSGRNSDTVPFVGSGARGGRYERGSESSGERGGGRRRVRNASEDSSGEYFEGRSRGQQLYVNSHTMHDSMSFGQSFDDDEGAHGIDDD